jgi:hypothetical protein
VACASGEVLFDAPYVCSEVQDFDVEAVLSKEEKIGLVSGQH